MVAVIELGLKPTVYMEGCTKWLHGFLMLAEIIYVYKKHKNKQAILLVMCLHYKVT